MITDHQPAMREQQGRQQFTAGSLASLLYNCPVKLASFFDKSLKLKRVGCGEYYVGRSDQQPLERLSRVTRRRPRPTASGGRAVVICRAETLSHLPQRFGRLCHQFASSEAY